MMEMMGGIYNPHIKPGVFELYCGPMKSGKTLQLIHRVDILQYIQGCNFQFFKPALDTRTPDVSSRYGSRHTCIPINEKNPSEILERITSSTQSVALDEAQFFQDDIDKVVQELVKRDINVIAAGLDLDFRGEPFGPMPRLLSIADLVYKTTGICEYNGCGAPSTRTQRLVDGKPAPYDSPIIMIEDLKKESYQCRCLRHHEVPGKP